MMLKLGEADAALAEYAVLLSSPDLGEVRVRVRVGVGVWG